MFKFVLRLVTEDGQLLAWCQHQLKPQPHREEGYSEFRVPSSSFLVVKAGTVAWCVTHWCDVDVARKAPPLGGSFEIPESQVGGTVRLDWTQALWGVSGSAKPLLPIIAVGESQVVRPGPAGMGAASPL